MIDFATLIRCHVPQEPPGGQALAGYTASLGRIRRDGVTKCVTKLRGCTSKMDGPDVTGSRKALQPPAQPSALPPTSQPGDRSAFDQPDSIFDVSPTIPFHDWQLHLQRLCKSCNGQLHSAFDAA